MYARTTLLCCITIPIIEHQWQLSNTITNYWLPTLDHLMRISIEGPLVHLWDPYPALRKWESMGNRRIQVSCQQSHDSQLAFNDIVFHTDEDGDNDWIYIYLCFNYLSAPVFLKKNVIKGYNGCIRGYISLIRGYSIPHKYHRENTG